MNISILTPIYNRSEWMPLMVYNINNLDYNKKLLEWVILDSKDGDKNIKLFENIQDIKKLENTLGIKITYKYIDRKCSIGEKRNMLTKLATHKICANMDSDDILLPSWLNHSLEIMNNNSKCSLVGTNGMIFCFPDDDFMLSGIQCAEKRQIHESGMVYTKKHHKSMGGFQKSSQGEGSSMIDFSENRVCCTDATKVIVCICHDNNTINKNRFRSADINQKLNGEIRDIIKNILPDITPSQRPKIILHNNMHTFTNQII